MEMERIDGILRLESMISLEESINDKKRLMKSIFSELKH
jgi:Lrp/AsnC family transcriptional regulator for asnA, asnC and gidA